MTRRSRAYEHSLYRRKIAVQKALSYMRIIIPQVMSFFLVLKLRGLYIPELGIDFSREMSVVINASVHLCMSCVGMMRTDSRGWGYDIASCFLATELMLFLCFFQHEPLLSFVLLFVFLCGFVAVLTGRADMAMQLFGNALVPYEELSSVTTDGDDKDLEKSLKRIAIRRYMVITAALLLAVPSIAVVGWYGYEDVRLTGNQHAIMGKEGENRLLTNIDTIRLFETDRWEQLDEQEKLNALQVIADIETAHLNIERVTVTEAHLEEGVSASYQYTGRQLLFDLEKHEDWEPVSYIHTILHECRHAYQHDCTESLDWSSEEVKNGIYYAQARTWLNEQRHYISGTENKEQYRNQEIERDANQYASEGTEAYYQLLDFLELPAR